jgi:hypothetical protein
MAGTDLTNFINKNQHVDTTINESQFMSSARCVIYAAPNTGATSQNAYTEYQAIGVIQGYNWAEQRQIDLLFEIGSEVPYLIPGRTTGQISLSRMLIYGADLTNVLMGNAKETDSSKWIKSLKDISKPFNLLFAAYSNTNTSDGKPKVYYRLFENCWKQSRNEQLSSGQVIIAENCALMYEQIGDVNIVPMA